MTKEISFPLSTIDLNTQPSTVTIHNPLIPIAQYHEQKPSSSYLTLSRGDNRRSDLSDFQDPLFYEQPLHLHYKHPIPSTTGLGHETGDRVRLTNDMKSNDYLKQKSVSSRKHRIEKGKSTHRRCTNSKKSKNSIIKTKEKKKQTSSRTVNKRKHNNKKLSQSSIQQLRRQSKTRQELLLKHRHRQKMLLKERKKKLLKQRLTSKKGSILKLNKNKSLTSTQRSRRLNITNNRITTPISSRRSSIIQPSTQSNKNLALSITPLIDNPTIQKALDKIKQRTVTPILSSISESTSKQMTNVTNPPSTPANLLSSSGKLEQKVSKKNLLRSKSNIKRLAMSKSKQRNHRGAKLNIRSLTHTTFKKNLRTYRKRKSAGRKTKFPQCTSKTLITIAPMNTNTLNENMKSSSVFSLKNSLTNKLSSTSTVMPLTKKSAQLTSKNNNKRVSKIKRRRNHLPSIKLGRKLIGSTRTGMTLRSRTIIINNDNSSKRSGKIDK